MRSFSRKLIEVISYVAVALGAVSSALSDRAAVIGDGIDMYGTFWFYWWIKHCVQTGADPSTTDLMFHPLGKDIFAHTGGNFLDAFASIPFQLALGTPGFQPVFIAAVLIANALSFRALMSHLVDDKNAAWASTLIWMVNPFVMFELLTGRITQAFVVFLPLAFLYFLRSTQGTRRDAALAGLFTALQAWTYWFMGWFMAFMFGWLAIREYRSSVDPRGLIGRWMVSAGVCAGAIIPAAWLMAARESGGDVPGLGNAGGIEGFLAAMGGEPVRALHGVILTEMNGIPLFSQWFWAAAACIVLLHVRSRMTWGVGAVMAFAFSIGPALATGEGATFAMPHYVLAYHVVPYLERLWFPYRWIVMAFFAVSVGVGVVFADLMSRVRSRWAWLLPPALLSLTLVEQVDRGGFPIKAQQWEVPGVYEAIGVREGGLIELPMMVPRASLMFQSVHKQPLFGGMGENAPVFWPDGFKHQVGNHFIRALRHAVRTQETPRAFLQSDVQALQDLGFRWVVLDRHTMFRVLHRSAWWKANKDDRPSAAGWTVARLSAMLGEPVAVDGDLVVWDLEGGGVFGEGLEPTSANTQSLDWTGMTWPAYEAELERLNAE